MLGCPRIVRILIEVDDLPDGLSDDPLGSRQTYIGVIKLGEQTGFEEDVMRS